MKIKCLKQDILDGLQAVQSIVGGKTPLAILSNVLLEAEGKELVLTTTDLEVGMRRRVPAKVERKGTVTLPAKRLLAILRELPVTEVTLEATDGKEVEIRYGASYFKVLGLPKDDFPALPQFDKAMSLAIGRAAFAELIRKTHYAVSHDESRYVLNGLHLVLSGKKVIGVATDGRRLALCEAPARIPEGADRGIIIPTKAVIELGRALERKKADEGEKKAEKKDEEMVEVFLGDTQAAFATGDCTLVTRLVEGHFPNYQQVIPQRSAHKLLIGRAELLDAARRVSLLTSEQANSVKIALKKNRLILSTNTPEVGEAQEELTITYIGDEFAIAFNPQYLIDVLKNLDEPEIVFELTDALNPGVVRSGKSFLYVIMPIRLT
ncbi:MAG TPA: DNA polymerase III subunit beta [bacterium]|nr:DNA polymerase III subunit beta [Chlamydiota bacterium]HOE26089.1 DNA polymerase III subunit beta [bacterium]HQM53756.1 DNA polymerase III subunit beta [bacterium]